MTAVERGQELLSVKGRDLPPLALEYRNKLWKELGMCIEVALTAFAVYAQCVEKLECDDDLYAARPADRQWFAERRKP